MDIDAIARYLQKHNKRDGANYLLRLFFCFEINITFIIFTLFVKTMCYAVIKI